MGDRICVMKDGNIMQVAEPLTLYEEPDNLFVAGFIGSPPMNLFTGTVENGGAGLSFVESGNPEAPLRLRLDDSLTRRAREHLDRPLVLGIRPEHIEEAPAEGDPRPGRTCEAAVEVVEPMGAETYLYLATGAHSFIARLRGSGRFEVNRPIRLAFQLEKAHLFDAATGKRLP